MLFSVVTRMDRGRMVQAGERGHSDGTGVAWACDGTRSRGRQLHTVSCQK